MRFADAELLWLLTALPVLLLAGAWTLRRRRLALERFAGGSAAADRFRAEVDPHRRAIKRILTFLALAAAIVALARPQWSTRLEEVEREGADVVVMLDHSLSMTVADVAPDRLGFRGYPGGPQTLESPGTVSNSERNGPRRGGRRAPDVRREAGAGVPAHEDPRPRRLEDVPVRRHAIA